MLRRLKKSEDLLGLTVPKNRRRNDEFFRSAEWYHRRFDVPVTNYDRNGPRFSGTEFLTWFMDGAADDEYTWQGTFGAISIAPEVFPRRRFPVPYTIVPSYWPVNQMTRAPSVRGGEFTGRKVALECVELRGVLHIPAAAASGLCWDNVRVLLVLDLQPDRPVNQPDYYVDPVPQLFQACSFAGNALGTARPFSAQAMARFRVLTDKIYRVERDVIAATVSNNQRAVTMSFDVPQVSTIWNPGAGGAGVDQDLVQVDNQNVLITGTSTFDPLFVMPMLIDGSALTPSTFGPSGALAVPTAAHGQGLNAGVARISQRAALSSTNQVVWETPFLTAGFHTQPPVAGVEQSYLAPSIDAINSFTGGKDATSVHEVVDLGEMGYYTKYDALGMITSGAIWLIMCADNGAVVVGLDGLGPPPGPFSSTLCVTTWYGAE